MTKPNDQRLLPAARNVADTAPPKRGSGSGFPIATICGTMRLQRDMLSVADELTRQGYLVMMPLAVKDGSSLHNPTPITAEQLDRIHRAKIDMADLVVFVTAETCSLFDSTSRALYFGESTSAEWGYAKRLGKATAGVRVERRASRDAVIWIDGHDLESLTVADERSSVASTIARTPATGRRSARRQPARVVSAHTFRIG
ncbi:hypothetical protein MTY66_63110 (plasmid) [Mycolicibacterium sp. TY66]|jgi:nucleoside 2-deoxyribosyltransferase|uniref:hypothetical protein n=1 Tax=unclassified Mycolicibacterium TaxID=2636767 RepID=UPI001BB38E16|nr:MULTISPECIES: hypothetical protein [unclassified Mycolicibacterium]BCI84686.1 hypothetical protein MTY66_63110 [Mycolicibacterium sp. TY66]BCJ84915.1 hypothetical protein MTY81_62880 [Mycolicibacterium sp. TY81]